MPYTTVYFDSALSDRSIMHDLYNILQSTIVSYKHFRQNPFNYYPNKVQLKAKSVVSFK